MKFERLYQPPMLTSLEMATWKINISMKGEEGLATYK